MEQSEQFPRRPAESIVLHADQIDWLDRLLLHVSDTRGAYGVLDTTIWPPADCRYDRKIANAINGLSELVEPLDIVLGRDPKRLKSRTFRSGVVVGLQAGRGLLPEVETIIPTLNKVVGCIGATGQPVEEILPRELERMAHNLVELAGAGLGVVDGLGEFVEKAATILCDNANNLIYAKLGMGLGLLVYQQASMAADIEAMQREADRVMRTTENEWAAAMSELVAGGYGDTEN